MENEKGLIFNSLDDVLKNSMISYAQDVIMDRALPRVEDGLKPVQRRILYSMYEMGLTPDKPHKKCAKIVGDCLGKYHPHGDSSVYGALVHMAQNFNMRMPLIDGHGNFGTVDGDSAAAYRYTEARLDALSLELLKDIEEDTVDFSLNFDDSMTEPDTLPGRFPNLLVNGATGIAVGLATNIPTHNLGEVINGTVAYIDNPKISLKEMMKHIPGPDFPTGGYIVANEELAEAYKTGRGKIRIRARVTVENETSEKKNLVISELPYQVNKAELLKKISDLKESKKDDVLSGIAEVVDESDRNGMRAVIKLRKDADARKILKYLFKNTSLETSFGINMVAIADGKPCQMGLLEIIGYYVNYQRNVVLRRSKYRLERAKERAHILEGLIIAVKNIDEVVKIIKNADNTADARAKLRARFDLSEAQATAILDLRLARLTKLEVTKLEEELRQLKKLIDELTAIIASKAKQMEVVKTEMLAIKKKFADGRRSKIIGNDDDDNDPEEKLPTQIDDFVVAVTYGNTFKKMTERNFSSSDRKLKDNSCKEEFIKIVERVKSNEVLLAFTNKGNMFVVNPETAPECRYRENGSKLSDVLAGVSSGEYPVSFYVVRENDYGGHLLFFTKFGMIKKTELKEYCTSKNAYQAIKLKDGDELIRVEKDEEGSTICFVTEEGLCLNALKDEVPVQGRVASGVKGINLNDNDKIVFVRQIDDEGELVVVSSAGTYKRVLTSEIEPLPRYRKGVKICQLANSNTIIAVESVKEPFDMVVIDNFGVSFKINTEDLQIETRTGKGKQLKNEHKKRIPVSAFRLI